MTILAISPTEWATLLTAIGGFAVLVIGALATAAVKVIQALRETDRHVIANTQVTSEAIDATHAVAHAVALNTADRAEKSAAQAEQIAALPAAVADAIQK